MRACRYVELGGRAVLELHIYNVVAALLERNILAGDSELLLFERANGEVRATHLGGQLTP